MFWLRLHWERYLAKLDLRHHQDHAGHVSGLITDFF